MNFTGGVGGVIAAVDVAIWDNLSLLVVIGHFWFGWHPSCFPLSEVMLSYGSYNAVWFVFWWHILNWSLSWLSLQLYDWPISEVHRQRGPLKVVVLQQSLETVLVQPPNWNCDREEVLCSEKEKTNRKECLWNRQVNCQVAKHELHSDAEF